MSPAAPDWRTRTTLSRDDDRTLFARGSDGEFLGFAAFGNQGPEIGMRDVDE